MRLEPFMRRSDKRHRVYPTHQFQIARFFRSSFFFGFEVTSRTDFALYFSRKTYG